MEHVTLITGVVSVSDGRKPLMGPERTIPLVVEVRTTGGSAILELSQAGALELVEALSRRLKARGCL